MSDGLACAGVSDADVGHLGGGAAAGRARAAAEIPFAVFYRIGLPVGRRGDWFGYAFPSYLGWALIALTDLVALYLSGCVASAVWTRGRWRRERRWG
jgi:hypothetical protein